MVRDFTKWDDTPVSLQHFAESAVRAYKIAMTPPTLPVVLIADTQLQDEQIPAGERLSIPKLSLTTPPSGDTGAIADVAKMLVAAENPVIVTGAAGERQRESSSWLNWRKRCSAASATSICA